MSIIISAFPGMGKIHFIKSSKNLKVLDLNSVNYKYIKADLNKISGTRREYNPEFPNNYIEKLKEVISSADAPDIVFVPTHTEILNALEKNKIKYFIVYPALNDKKDFITRYRSNGNSSKFIVNMESNWERFIDNIINETYPVHIKSKDITPELVKSFGSYDEIISLSHSAAKLRKLDIVDTEKVNWSIISRERKNWDDMDFAYKNYIDWDNLCKFGKVPEKIITNPAFSKYIVWGYLEKNKNKYSMKARKLISKHAQTHN